MIFPRDEWLDTSMIQSGILNIQRSFFFLIKCRKPHPNYRIYSSYCAISPNDLLLFDSWCASFPNDAMFFCSFCAISINNPIFFWFFSCHFPKHPCSLVLVAPLQLLVKRTERRKLPAPTRTNFSSHCEVRRPISESLNKDDFPKR